MPDQFVKVATAVMAVIALVLYVAGVVLSLIYTFKGGKDPSFVTSEATRYVTTGLAGLVGGVAATAFGQAPPDPNGGTANRATRNLSSLGKVVTASASAAAAIGMAYVSAYLLLGLAALVAWLVKGGDTLELTKTLASTFFGLLIVVTGAFLRERD
jgi:hypothetical protein